MGFWKHGKRDKDLDEELQSHLRMAAKDRMERGEPPGEAELAARRELGNAGLVKEVTRGMWGRHWLDELALDARFGLRILRKSPAFVAVAVLTLALGIGANTAIFSVVNAVLLKPLPYPEANRLAIVWSAWGKEERGPASGPELVELGRRSRLFEEVAGIWVTGATINGSGEPEQVRLGQVTVNFLPLLALRPELGRFFSASDVNKGSSPVMIISDGLWRRQFGADPAIVGKPIRLGGGSVTIAGVMPPDFKLMFPDDSSVPPDVQAFTPFRGDMEKNPRNLGFIRIIARLRQGVSFKQAQSEADGIAGQLRSGFKEFADQGLRLHVFPLQTDDVRNVRSSLLALFGSVGLVLLIACANIANLFLSRLRRRQLETTVRAALGAPRTRIIRQLLTESVLLGCISGVVAVVVGWAALKWLLAMRPAAISRLGWIGLDWQVLAFTLALSIITGIVFGLTPALGSTRINLVTALRDGGKNATPDNRRLRSALVTGEVALGFLLLAGTGLMVRTFVRLLQVDPGFQADQVLTFQISIPGAKFQSKDGANNFLTELQRNLAALPGVTSVGVISHLPLDEGLPNWYSYFWADGAPVQDQNTVMADQRSTSPEYFKTIGATIISGRDFNELDDAAHPHVVIVDDSLAQQTWPNQDPIGKKLSVEDSPAGPFAFIRDTVEVVGVVRHVQYHSLTKNVRAQIYFPYALAPRPQVSIAVRSTSSLPTLVGPIRQEVAKLDKQLPLSHVLPLATHVDEARASTRFATVLGGALAAVALIMVCIGIYGVTSYGVVQRTNEIGIRLALGGDASQMLMMIVRQGMLPVIGGLLAGCLISLALTPLLSSLLFGVKPSDPFTFMISTAFLLTVATVSAYLPARRAMRVDPIVALRYE